MTRTVDTLPLRACIEGFIQQVEEQNSITIVSNNKVNILRADINMLAELGLTHGTHKEDCSYIEEIESGRVIDNEAEACDCGWYSARSILEGRVEQYAKNHDRSDT